MKRIFLLILFFSTYSFADETLETIEVVEQEDGSFSGYWEENKGTQIFSGKKNTVTELKELPKLQTNNYRQASTQTPGLLISEIPNESLAALTYRGLGDPHESYHLLLLQDGLPVAADMYGYPAHYYAPALPMMEKFQFIRGGAALHHGPQPGGVVNYISRAIKKNQNLSGTVGLTGGSYNLLTTNNSLFGSSKDHSYSLEYYRRQGDGPQRINSDFFGDYLQIRDHLFKGKNTFTLTFNGYNSDHGESGGFSRNTGTGLNVFGGDQGKASKEHDRLKVHRAQLSIGAIHRTDENSLLELTIWGNAYNRYSKRQNKGTAPQFGGFYNGTTNQIVDQRYYGYNSQIRFLKNYEFFGNEHTLSMGFLNYNLISPLVQETGDAPDSNHGTVTKRSDRKTHTNSYFIENRFSFGNLMVTPGMRVENIRQVINERKSTDPLRKDDSTENVPLLGLGLSYHTTDESQLYANISEAYRPLTWSDALPTLVTDTVSSDIESAKTLNSEFGYRGQTDKINWDFSLFHIRYENKIAKVGTVYQNSGSGTHRGIDGATEIKLSNFLPKLKTLGDFHLYGNFNILDARYTRGTLEDKTPQYAPKSLSRGGVIYKKENQFKIALMGVVVGEHYADDGNSKDFKIPSYTVFDLTSDWELRKDWNLSLGVNNLLDKNYYSRVRSDGIIWALGRNIYAGLSYDF